jgi:hypothetical protein
MKRYLFPDLLGSTDAAGIDCDGTPGDFAVFTIPYKCTVIRAACTVTEVCAGSTSTPVVAFDKRPTAGSDTSRGAADVANFALSTTAAGKVMYDEGGAGVALEPGNEVVVQLVTAAVGTPTGHFRPHLEVMEIPDTPGNLDNLVETA